MKNSRAASPIPDGSARPTLWSSPSICFLVSPIAIKASFASLLSCASPSFAAARREPTKPYFREFSKMFRFLNSSMTISALSFPTTSWTKAQLRAYSSNAF